ncbi:MAG: hypothetical protein IPH04_12590 [Saprospirales bacterium]|jgi:cytochrome c5|nr:hypothetical protein [Saprospirales bacterium]MBK7338683.1 hypothetical protein [Saprospirales bacterium]
MKKILFVYCILLFWACSATVLRPTQSDADRAASAFPGLTLAQLQEGRTLYEGQCGKCHALKPLTSKDEAGWRKIVPIMAGKAEIDSIAEKLILQYVVTMSGAKR